MKSVFTYIDKNKNKFIKRLQELCRQESISAQNRGMKETAALVKKYLSSLGAAVKYLEVKGKGYPAVYGRIKGKGSKTVLFYNHYDVQPPDPLHEWKHKPFAASITSGRMYGRGTSDNKGDLIARLSAVEAFLKVRGSLPVNAIFFVEGEEEIGSINLDKIITKNQSLLNSDCCIWECGEKTFSGQLNVYLGVKGLLYVELDLTEAKYDSHSSRAATIPNPAWKLVHALNSLKDSSEKILIDGFMDDVVPLTEKEKKAISKIPVEDKKIMKDMGIKNFVLGLKGKNRILRDISAPTCTICGINAGYTGPGSKTVLPRKAAAKVGFRLVPNQDPSDILKKLRKHLDKHGFSQIEIKGYQATNPFKTSLDAEISKIVIESAREVYGKEPVVYPTFIATGPMYNLCGRLNIPCVSIGVGNAQSRMHGPNENIKINDFVQGIKHISLIMEKLGD